MPAGGTSFVFNNAGNRVSFGAQSPQADSPQQKWIQHDIRICDDATVIAGGTIGWICTVSGRPGTWVAITTGTGTGAPDVSPARVLLSAVDDVTAFFPNGVALNPLGDGILKQTVSGTGPGGVATVAAYPNIDVRDVTVSPFGTHPGVVSNDILQLWADSASPGSTVPVEVLLGGQLRVRNLAGVGQTLVCRDTTGVLLDTGIDSNAVNYLTYTFEADTITSFTDLVYLVNGGRPSFLAVDNFSGQAYGKSTPGKYGVPIPTQRRIKSMLVHVSENSLNGSCSVVLEVVGVSGGGTPTYTQRYTAPVAISSGTRGLLPEGPGAVLPQPALANDIVCVFFQRQSASTGAIALTVTLEFG